MDNDSVALKRKSDGLDMAIHTAMMHHWGQVDKAGQPYILHPLSVMFRVRRAGFDETHQIVAVLHDTIEDSSLTVENVRQCFGSTIADAIEALTRRSTKWTEELDRLRRFNVNVPESAVRICGEETYQQYIERVKLNPIARAVKAADLEDNLDASRHAWADKFPEAYTALMERYRKALDSLRADD